MTEDTEHDVSADLEPVIDTTTPAEAPGARDAEDNGDAEDTGIADAVAALGLKTMSLQELKEKSPADLLAFAETFEVENANSMRKQDMMFAILKTLAEEGVEISGSGTMEVLQDGFGFLRSPEANYLPGPDDIYV
ncbi:transcription termination factor Rho, partial [Pseudomonas sp. HMWF010]